MCFAGISFAGISIDPSRIELVMENGQTYSGKYTVINGNDDPIELVITYDTWKNSPENSTVTVTDWLKVKQSKVLLKPQQTISVEYSINSGNLVGSVSAMVSFTYRLPTVSNMSMMTSLPIYVSIAGTQKVDFFIKNLSAVNGGRDKDNIVVVELQNDGNVPIRPSGKLEIFSGKKLVSSALLSDLDPVYAGLNRAYYRTIEKLPKGKYTLKISLNGLDKTVEKSIQFKVNKYGEVINQ